MGSRQSTVAAQPDAIEHQGATTSLSDRIRERAGALVARLFSPIDISALVVFRIAFGLVMIWEMNRYISQGWVDSIYLEPQYLFPYQTFEWVKPWPGDWLHVHFHVLAAFAAMMALGLWYRIAATLFWLGFTYIFLLDKGHYLNHFYLGTLISFLMIFVPANRAFSLDVWRHPKIATDTIPAWPQVLLASQFAVVYIFGGIAKINGDWLRGKPMDRWLPNSTDFPFIGRWFSEGWMAYLVSYSGLVIDLFIVPLLLWRKTRWFAVVVLVLFHRLNAELFSIGIFPTFATAGILLFLPPDLPRRVINAFRPQTTKPRRSVSSRGSETATQSIPFWQRPLSQRATAILVIGYIAMQFLVPWRFLLYPGNPAWTDQGDRFAWRMMLHSKVGEITYIVTDPNSGETWEVDPSDYLTSTQVGYLTGQPDMILQFSHFLADEWASKGYDDVEVRAETMVSLNSRPHVPIVDSTVDLASVNLTITDAPWITSLDEQLRRVETAGAE